MIAEEKTSRYAAPKFKPNDRYLTGFQPPFPTFVAGIDWSAPSESSKMLGGSRRTDMLYPNTLDAKQEACLAARKSCQTSAAAAIK